jgi:hypothetical protein
MIMSSFKFRVLAAVMLSNFSVHCTQTFSSSPGNEASGSLLSQLESCVDGCDAAYNTERSEECGVDDESVCTTQVRHQWLACMHFCVEAPLLDARQICISDCDLSLLQTAFMCGNSNSLMCLTESFLHYIICKRFCEPPVPWFAQQHFVG